MDNAQLIAEARGLARYNWPVQRERFEALADALEAAEAELTAAHTAIAGSPTKAERVASLVKSATRLVQIERDDARAALARAEAELTRRETEVAATAIHEALHQYRIRGEGDEYSWLTEYALELAAASVSLEAVSNHA